MTNQSHESKRHHFIPETYLNHFRNSEGIIQVYRKDDPNTPFPSTPHNIGVKSYYYSQLAPDGTRDNNTIEQFFSTTVESKWNHIVNQLIARADLSDDEIRDAAWFCALQHARVPAIRDAHESLRASSVKFLMKKLDSMGKLPAPPNGAPDILDRLEVAIDPQTSLANIHVTLNVVETIFDRITIRIVHNTSGTDYLTSDNPVVWFDPGVHDSMLRPYALRPNGPVVFLFPVTPNVMLYGDSRSDDYGWNHVTLADEPSVKKMNSMICRFGYESVYCRDRSHEALIVEHSRLSPIMQSSSVPSPDGHGDLIINTWAFGHRSRKPKWTGS